MLEIKREDIFIKTSPGKTFIFSPHLISYRGSWSRSEEPGVTREQLVSPVTANAPRATAPVSLADRGVLHTHAVCPLQVWTLPVDV